MMNWNKEALIGFIAAIIGITLMLVHAYGQDKDILVDTHEMRKGQLVAPGNKEIPNHNFSLNKPPKFGIDPKKVEEPPAIPTGLRIVITEDKKEEK